MGTFNDVLESLRLALVRLERLLPSLFPRPNYDEPIEENPMNLEVQQEKENLIYDTALSFLGKDASPLDTVPDRVACVDSLTRILKKALLESNFPILDATEELAMYLLKSPSWMQVTTPKKGDVVVAVSTYRGGERVYGHCWVVGQNLAPDGTLWLMSNNSDGGKWEVNGTLGSCIRLYKERKGLEVLYFAPM